MSFRLLLICFILTSCSASRYTETALYFGQSRPDGSLITQNEWESFKGEQVARIFKEGSTVLNGTGSWYDTASKRLINEPTYVVIFYYKNSQRISTQIDSLRHFYKIRFQQQSVLRVDKKVKVDF